jgi:DeoR family transcriptional regulator of aga operon
METSFLSNTERQNQILRLIDKQSRITIVEICEQFAVSEATARRDLEELTRQGKIQRVHGGAIALQESIAERPILQRESEQSAEKLSIGAAAAKLVGEKETIFLGSGTTVIEVARALRARVGLTILTNSLPVLNVLSGTQNTVICLGGMLRSSELSFIGHITEQALNEVRADKVFMGTRAISLEFGLTHEFLPETMTDRAILRAGREVIIVADHTKFGRAATVLLAPVERIHTIVTDSGVDEATIQDFMKRGIQMIMA